MSGGDPRLDVSDTVPQVTAAEVASVLSTIGRQPRERWAELKGMLGLDGARVVVHRAGRPQD